MSRSSGRRRGPGASMLAFASTRWPGPSWDPAASRPVRRATPRACIRSISPPFPVPCRQALATPAALRARASPGIEVQSRGGSGSRRATEPPPPRSPQPTPRSHRSVDISRRSLKTDRPRRGSLQRTESLQRTKSLQRTESLQRTKSLQRTRNLQLTEGLQRTRSPSRTRSRPPSPGPSASRARAETSARCSVQIRPDRTGPESFGDASSCSWAPSNRPILLKKSRSRKRRRAIRTLSAQRLWPARSDSIERSAGKEAIRAQAARRSSGTRGDCRSRWPSRSRD